MNEINRREWMTMAGAAGLIAATGTACTTEEQQTRVPGIQLYTVRDSMAEDMVATIGAVAGIGYREVEFAGYFGRSAMEVRELLDRFGLTSPSTHISGSVIRDDIAAVVGNAAEIGHDYVTIAWIEEPFRQSAADWYRWAEDANKLGELCRQHGMRAAYHNHEFEYQTIDGIVPFDVLLNETDPELMDFELDFYWIRKGGRDILDVIREAPQRMTMAHIKDIDAAGDIVDVGMGEIDFAGILAAPESSAIRHAFVEHDRPADPFRTAAFSHLALEAALGSSKR